MIFDVTHYLDDMCNNLAGFTIADIEPHTMAAAKACLIDTFGVGLAGARHSAVHKATTWAGGSYADGPCQLMGGRAGLPAAGAAFVNGVACHALDFDDTSYDGIVHASAVVLPAALSLAEREGAGGGALLTAFIAGCQAAVEIGRLLTDGVYYRGWFNTALLGQLGASVAAARALGADGEQMSRTLSLSACSASGIRAVLGTEAKPYLAGRAAENGVRSAEMVRAGLSVPEDPWLHRDGVLSTIGFGIAPGAHPRLGRWCFDEPGVALKMFPVCSAAQAAAEGLQAVMIAHNLERSQIREIIVGGTELVVRSLRYEQPETPQQAQFSMQFAVGCILLHNALGPEHLNIETLEDASLRAAMSKVRLALDEELENAPGRADHSPEAARLTIELTDGHRIEHLVPAASGMPARPFTLSQLERKFMSNALFGGMSPATARDLWDKLSSIEKLTTLSGLTLN